MTTPTAPALSLQLQRVLNTTALAWGFVARTTWRQNLPLRWNHPFGYFAISY